MSVPGLSTRTDRQAARSVAPSATQRHSRDEWCGAEHLRLDAHLCDWCGYLNDVARLAPCPCIAKEGQKLVVQHRHCEAAARAEASGWAATTRQLNSRWPRREPRLTADPTGREWVA
jgi:hypothetical protein